MTEKTEGVGGEGGVAEGRVWGEEGRGGGGRHHLHPL